MVCLSGISLLPTGYESHSQLLDIHLLYRSHSHPHRLRIELDGSRHQSEVWRITVAFLSRRQPQATLAFQLYR